MPPCYCQWAKCSGSVVSKRLFDDHQRQDRRAQVKAALDAADRATEGQEARVADYISATTLSDDTMASPTRSGGRLWARNIDDNAAEARTLPYLPVTEALRTISDVRDKLEALTAAVESSLQKIGIPTTSHDAFPLEHLLRDVSLLQDQLNGIDTRRKLIQDAKRPLVDELQAVFSRLH